MRALPSQLTDPRPRLRVPAEVFPLVGAFIAISFAFGVLARESGLSLGHTLLMSAVVYAGTSQVVALGLLAAGQPAWLIVLITLLINSRFMLMSSVMAQPTLRWNPLLRWLFAYQLTDETFAVLIDPKGGVSSEGRALWIQASAYVAWIIGTAMGFVLGGNSDQLRGLGLDFALVAMMLAVLILQIRTRQAIVVAAVAGVLAIVVTRWGLSWAAPLLAAVFAPSLGVWLEEHWTKS